MEREVSGTEDGGGDGDTNWLGLRDNCGAGGDAGVRLVIRRGLVDSAVRLRGGGICMLCLCTVGIKAAC